MDLDGVADELYGLAPSEFVAARDAHAKAARATGYRELAGQIKGLRKPTTVAWIANQLARRHPADIQALADLGHRLRRAMATPSGPELRALNVEQRRAVQALVAAARALALADGRPLAEPTVEDLTDTLHAALADPALAEALAGGRLAEGLTPPGFGMAPAPAAAPPEALREVGPPEADDAHRARDARVDQARMDVEAAQDQVAEARRALIHATAALQRASARAGQAAEHVEQLRAELAEATRARDRAQQQDDDAEAARDDADSAVRQAERRLRDAVNALEAAQGESPAG